MRYDSKEFRFREVLIPTSFYIETFTIEVRFEDYLDSL